MRQQFGAPALEKFLNTYREDEPALVLSSAFPYVPVRREEEVEHWRARDPIARYRTYLEHTGVWTQRLEERVAHRSQRLRAELRDAVITEPDIDIGEVFDTVYHDITPDLARQRDELLAELAKEA